MSLKVWLPLNGNLKNYGLSNLTFTNYGAVVDNNGKIGKCYDFSDEKKLTADQNFTINKTSWSVAGWLYPTAYGASSMQNKWAVTLNVSSASNFLFALGLYSTTNVFNMRLNGTSYTTTSSNTIDGVGRFATINQWHHFAVTCNNNLIKFYVNGELVRNLNYTSTLPDNATKLVIGGRGGLTTGAWEGKLNDIRVYDNCLSAAEVKEIARGMVVHYRLDNYGCRNLLPGTTSQTKFTTNTINWTTGQWSLQSGGNGTARIVNDRADLPISGITQYWTIDNNTSGNRDHGMTVYPRPLEVGQSYTISFYARGTGTLQFRIWCNGTAPRVKAWTLTENWTYYTWSFTATESMVSYESTALIGVRGAGQIDMCAIQLEQGTTATPWTPHVNDFCEAPRITDNSGYGHHGIIAAPRKLDYRGTSARYNSSIYIDQGTTNNIHATGLNLPQFPLTACIWFKSTNTAPTGDYHQPFTLRSADNTKSMGIFVYKTGPFRGGVTVNGANSWANVNGTNALDGEWHFCAITYDGETLKKYFDGELGASTTVANTGDAAILDNLYIGSYPSQYGCVDTYLSDFRLYSTVLLDTDIKMLYNTSMRIDKNHNAHTFQALQTRENLFAHAEIARAAGKGMNTSVGLYNFHQNNCQVTCDERGFRIYRPPDLAAGSGNKTFGGLVLRNSTSTSIHVYNPERDNIFGLINGHTYVWAMTISGHTHSVPTFTINNNTGYVSNATRGLNTTPTNVKQHNIPADFDGTQEVFYKFTISDTIVKTCKQSYSNFVEGNDYLAYMDFAWRWDYLATGEQGTEIYVSNLRLYDITDMPDFTIGKDGVVRAQDFIEAGYGTKIQFDSELLANEIIER